MFSTPFHAIGGNSPNRRSHIDFGPKRAARLAAPRCAQDQEFERARRYGLALPELADEGRNLFKGHCGMVASRKPLGSGEQLVEMPSPSSGISFVRRPLARAASSTASTRPRSRDAISGLVCQTGRRMLRTSWVVISATDFSRRGFAYISAPRRGSRAPRDASHCSRCLAFFSEGAIAARYSSATSPNVTGRGGACAAFEARLPSIGSSPAPTSRRASAASARAFASGTSLAEPRPISRSLPGGETGKPTGARHARRCSGRAHHHPHDARDPEEPRPSGRLTGAVPDPCSPLCPNFCPNFGAGFYGTTADAQRRSRNKAEENHENTVG